MMGEETSASRMTRDRLRAIIESYGADAERWPAEERQSALALLETSAEARAMREAAAALDDTLSELQAPATSEGAMDRVRSMVVQARPARHRPSWLVGLFPISLPQIAAFASVALVAFLLGASLPRWDVPAPLPAAPDSDSAAVVAGTETTEAPVETEIGDLAIVDGFPGIAEDGTFELAAAEAATTENVDSLTNIPLQ